MKNILTPAFFERPTIEVARYLLGKSLVRQKGAERISLIINEVEAYDGFEDRASHAYRGRTPRTEIMFGPAGYWYIYFCYGMHWMMNIVTGEKDYPAAILLRGAGDISGPGRLSKFLEVDKRLNGKPATVENGLWFEDSGIPVDANAIQACPRIGVAYAGPIWAKKPYRFMLRYSY